jgi:hypothetical protein
MASSYYNSQIEIARIQMLLDLIIGNVAGILSLFVFAQKSMRHNSCVTFFIAWSVATMLYLNHIVLSFTLARGYGIDPASTYPIYCKIRYYYSALTNILVISFLVAASVDRVLVSSPNARIRLWSTRYRALLSIAMVIVFWMLLFIPLCFFTGIQLVNGGPSKTCAVVSGIPTTILSYYTAVCVNLIPLVLLAGCGIKTLWNIRSTSVQRRPLLRSKDRTVILLLLLQIVVYSILRIPAAINYFYSEFSKGNSKNADQVALDSLISSVVLFAQFTHVAISPLVNFLTQGFRQELRKAIFSLLRIERINENDNLLTRGAGTIHRRIRQNRNAIHPTVDVRNIVTQC